ncbi:hypothetical protein FHR75_004200 [Kineococcus radiotolerans]|uniref:Uncharacterized protein n=1 Tax=Kineococcus radiotolerans TaxID=131568 RepID=A0A7W4TRG5_KINRA|nr:hypothetical protein [Kineococcus radiotolerans]MBB2903358.1 hypothetical protein [Kineococcus radiotolerans]
MNDLLTFALEAHGGLPHWSELTTVEANLSITGALWKLKSRPDVLNNVRLRAHLHEQRVVLNSIGANGTRSVFERGRLSLYNSAGDVVEVHENPDASFAGQNDDTPWDDLHVAHFTTKAMWTYLTIPFLYTYPGFRVQEVASRHEQGEVWRGLQVTFPDHIATHTRSQTSYFGPDGLLRRHDYTVDVLGGASGANFALQVEDFDGIKVPTLRRVFAYDQNGDAIPDPVLINIKIRDAHFA